MGRDLDAQGPGGLAGAAETAGHARGTAVALEHVVPGHEVDGPVGVAARSVAVDHRQQVGARQRVHLAEGRRRSSGASAAVVEPGGGEQGGDEVDVGGRRPRSGAVTWSSGPTRAMVNGTRVASS